MNEIAKHHRAEILKYLNDRFSIKGSCFENFSFYRPNSRYLNIIHKSHKLDHRFKIESLGMEFIKTRSKEPKLTTVATAMFGAFARKNYIDLRNKDLTPYLSRASWISQRQPHVESPGYVIVRYEGINLGLAFMRYENDNHQIESLFPKGRVKALSVNSKEGNRHSLTRASQSFDLIT